MSNNLHPIFEQILRPYAPPYVPTESDVEQAIALLEASGCTVLPPADTTGDLSKAVTADLASGQESALEVSAELALGQVAPAERAGLKNVTLDEACEIADGISRKIQSEYAADAERAGLGVDRG